MSPLEIACACNDDGYSGDVLTNAVGCANHGFPDVWCYVSTPAACYPATASTAYPGAAWIACSLSSGLPVADGSSTTSAGCTDQCIYAPDGECDDGGLGAAYSLCAWGSDCSDCGDRGGGDSLVQCLGAGMVWEGEWAHDAGHDLSLISLNTTSALPGAPSTPPGHSAYTLTNPSQVWSPAHGTVDGAAVGANISVDFGAEQLTGTYAVVELQAVILWSNGARWYRPRHDTHVACQPSAPPSPPSAPPPPGRCTDDPDYFDAGFSCADWVGWACKPAGWGALHGAASSSMDHWGLSFEQVVLLVHSCPESCHDVAPACVPLPPALPSTPPAPPSVPALSPLPGLYACFDTCYVSMADNAVPHFDDHSSSGVHDYNGDGTCDDGGAGALYSSCSLGGDCSDCGPRLVGPSCSNECSLLYPADGLCDDGGPGAEYAVCTFGTDCDDCGDRAAHGYVLPPSPPPSPPSVPSPPGLYACFDTCYVSMADNAVPHFDDHSSSGVHDYNGDGTCDDGGAGALYSSCSLGGDCSDCGPRLVGPSCSNECSLLYPADGLCDDGGPGAEYAVCTFGTDCDDCGDRAAHGYVLPPSPPPSPPSVPSPPSLPLGCSSGLHGADYRDSASTTGSGRECQAWTSQAPHAHTRTPSGFPNTGLGAHNFCRNPDGEPGGPWCYTMDPSVRWAYCSQIPECPPPPPPLSPPTPSPPTPSPPPMVVRVAPPPPSPPPWLPLAPPPHAPSRGPPG